MLFREENYIFLQFLVNIVILFITFMDMYAELNLGKLRLPTWRSDHPH